MNNDHTMAGAAPTRAEEAVKAAKARAILEDMLIDMSFFENTKREGMRERESKVYSIKSKREESNACV